MSDKPFPVYIGYDRREDIAYRVCKHSLEKHASVPIKTIPLVQDALRADGLYTRDIDPLAATDFTYTRFFIPYLAGYNGWAIFCDCDMLWLGDVAELIEKADDRYAAMCVHHDHRPSEKHKMDGRKQTLYPRKNWSSMIMYNCGHPANKALSPDLANLETGKYLHRFAWLEDELIGSVPESWNWLEGWNDKPETGTPDVVHYTRGGPWFEDWKDVDYGDLWLREEAELPAAP